MAMDLQYVRRQSPDPRRQRLYRQAILVAIVGNALLAAAKGAVAWYSGSSAVLSDAVNSLSDTLYSLMMAAGLYLAQLTNEFHEPLPCVATVHQLEDPVTPTLNRQVSALDEFG